jgi:hypothetical protein
MIAKALRILILTTAATLCALPLRAQIIHGTVVDGTSGATVRGAHIALLDLEGRTLGVAQSDSDGKFALRAPGEGRYLLRATHFAYVHAVTPAFEVSAAASVAIAFQLAPDPVRFDPLSVVVERREQRLEIAGFYQRQRLAFGKFITREKIAASPAISLTDLLRRYPGVQVVIDPNSLETDLILRGTTSDDRCYPSVAIDGMVVRAGGFAKQLLGQFLPPSEKEEEKAGVSIEFGLDTLAPPLDEIEAIELYPSLAGLPPFLVGRASPCGAVVIWTRR